MVQGRDRRPELGHKLAIECRKSIVYPIKNKNSKYNNMVADLERSMSHVNESNHNTAKVKIYLGFCIQGQPKKTPVKDMCDF